MKQKIFRSDDEWRALFTSQASSGLSAAAFYREHGLCPKHFSLRKKQLGAKVDSGFSELKVSSQPKRLSSGARVKSAPSGLSGRIRLVELELSDVSPESLSDVVRSLLR